MSCWGNHICTIFSVPDGCLGSGSPNKYNLFFRQAVTARKYASYTHTRIWCSFNQYMWPVYFYKYGFDLVRSDVARWILQHFLFCRCGFNRYQAVVQNSFHKVWNGSIDKSDLDPIWKRMEKMKPLQVIHTRERSSHQAAEDRSPSNPEGALG